MLFDYDAEKGRLKAARQSRRCPPDTREATSAPRSWSLRTASSSMRGTAARHGWHLPGRFRRNAQVRRRCPDPRQLPPQLQLRSNGPVSLLLQSASRQHDGLCGQSRDRRTGVHGTLCPGRESVDCGVPGPGDGEGRVTIACRWLAIWGPAGPKRRNAVPEIKDQIDFPASRVLIAPGDRD